MPGERRRWRRRGTLLTGSITDKERRSTEEAILFAHRQRSLEGLGLPDRDWFFVLSVSQSGEGLIWPRIEEDSFFMIYPRLDSAEGSKDARTLDGTVLVSGVGVDRVSSC